MIQIKEIASNRSGEPLIKLINPPGPYQPPTKIYTKTVTKNNHVINLMADSITQLLIPISFIFF